MEKAPHLELNPDFIDLYSRTVLKKEFGFPEFEGEFQLATLEGKYIMTRSGKIIWVSLIMSEKPPIIFTEEALNLFTTRFENLYKDELRNLYTEYSGNTSVLKSDNKKRQTVNQLSEEIFFLSVNLPHSLESIKNIEKTKLTKKIWKLAKKLTKKNDKKIIIRELLIDAIEKLEFDKEDIEKTIYNLIIKKAIKPIDI
ncbi:MAG: hypothetical protein GF353_24655 [Candidatus Lokiarchaeota archaeon]|nr:hypothetical protein [Candidatus Lokiarchaeota archaeon]